MNAEQTSWVGGGSGCGRSRQRHCPLGLGAAAVAIEAGNGTVASWWNAGYLGDPEVSSGWVGAGRVRVGAADDLELSVLGATGPENAILLAGEFKWRFAHRAIRGAEGSPGFHAATLTGFGAGALDLRNGERYPFIAPYSGVMASCGIDWVQMFAGLRFAASEVVGN